MSKRVVGAAAGPGDVPDSRPPLAIDAYRLLRKVEFCQILNLSLAQFNRLLKAGRIIPPLTRFGRSPRWSREIIVDWLDQGCPDPLYFRWKGKYGQKAQ